MINGIFRIDENDMVIIHSEAVKLIPEIKALDQKELLYLVLAYDYIKSLYRMKPLEERKVMARRRVYGKKETIPENNKKFEAAKSEYLKCIYEPKRASLEVYKQKVYEIDKRVRTTPIDEMSPNEVKRLDSLRQFYEKRINEINSHIENEEQEYVVGGDRELSFLEQWQMNQMKAIENAEYEGIMY